MYCVLLLHNDFSQYAGHYIPAIGHRILAGNAKLTAPNRLINLKALGIGNGWVDPVIQYRAYGDYAYYYNLIGKQHTRQHVLILAGETGYETFKASYVVCKDLIAAGLWPVALEECQLASMAVLEDAAIHLGYQPNVYNWKQKCENPPLCYDFTPLENFLAVSSTMIVMRS